VLRQLNGLAAHRLRLSVLATFDATRGMATAGFEEAAAQWAAAHRIVVTKADLVPGDAVARAAREIAALNPLAEIVATTERDRAVAAAFAPLAGSAPLPALPQIQMPTAHVRIAVRLARPTAELAYDDLAAWLDNLAGALGERLLRLKGLVRIKESPRPVLVQSVGTAFARPRPFGEPEPASPLFLMVIARDLLAGELETVVPTGLFGFSSCSEPSRPLSGGAPSPVSVAWV
jgi:G3E family GTPase